MAPIPTLLSINLAGENLTHKDKFNKLHCTMIYKSLNRLAPNYLRSKLTDRSSVTTFNLFARHQKQTRYSSCPHKLYEKVSVTLELFFGIAFLLSCGWLQTILPSTRHLYKADSTFNKTLRRRCGTD